MPALAARASASGPPVHPCHGLWLSRQTHPLQLEPDVFRAQAMLRLGRQIAQCFSVPADHAAAVAGHADHRLVKLDMVRGAQDEHVCRPVAAAPGERVEVVDLAVSAIRRDLY